MESSVGESSSSSHVVESSVGQRQRRLASAGRSCNHFRSNFSLMDRCLVESMVVEPLHDIVLPLHVQNGKEKRPYCGIGTLSMFDSDALTIFLNQKTFSGKRLLHSELEHASSASSPMNNDEGMS